MGSLVKKTVKGIAYLYWATHDHGVRHDEYLGRADDPKTQAKARSLKEADLQERYEALKREAQPLGLTFK